MFGYAKEGLNGAVTTEANADVAVIFKRLELATEIQQLAFLRFYGYWLGSGALDEESNPAIIFRSNKQTDLLFYVDWLLLLVSKKTSTLPRAPKRKVLTLLFAFSSPHGLMHSIPNTVPRLLFPKLFLPNGFGLGP